MIRPAPSGIATEQGLRVGLQLHLATKELFARRWPVWSRVRVGHQCAQCAFHGLQREQDAAFQSAERRQSVPHQLALQIAQIVMPERQVVREIAGADDERRLLNIALPALDRSGGLSCDRLAEVAKCREQFRTGKRHWRPPIASPSCVPAALQRVAEGSPVQQVVGRLDALAVPFVQAGLMPGHGLDRDVGRPPAAGVAPGEVQQPATLNAKEAQRARRAGIFVRHRRYRPRYCPIGSDGADEATTCLGVGSRLHPCRRVGKPSRRAGVAQW